MNFKLFGKSGLKVSEVCLGTMTFGEDWGWGASKDESRRIFDGFVEAGGNFFDTADGYTNGTSEKFLGEFIKGSRERFVISTKYSFNMRPGDPNAGGNHRKNMVQALEGSLKRLETDYVDVYWVHAWDQLTPSDEVMRGLDDLVRQGKILYVGVSNTPAWVVSYCNAISEIRGWARFTGLQVEYSLLERTPEREFLPMAKALGLAVTAWSPLCGGLLTGKYGEGSGVGEEKRLDKSPFVEIDERKLKIVETVKSVAAELGRSPAQVALAWTRKKSIPILGARTIGQLTDNLKCLEFLLSYEQESRLNQASAVPEGYPYEFLSKPMVRNYLHGGTFETIQN